MYKPNNVVRKKTGEFAKALIGPRKGKVGEIVKHWNWGGVDLEFSDGEVITYAIGDVMEIKALSVMNRPPAGFDAPFGQWYGLSDSEAQTDGEDTE